MKQNLSTVEALLRTAQPPKRLSNKEIKVRAKAICQDIVAQGGSVHKEQLREITAKHGMVFTSVGALFASGYLRASSKGIIVARRGMAVRGKGKKRERRVPPKKR